MNNNEIIWAYHGAIQDIYRLESLKCLRGENDSYMIKDKQILLWHSSVTRRCMIKYEFDRSKNLDDLLLHSDEIMHFTAQLYLYKPYLNDPIKDAVITSVTPIYPNIQNFEAKRYYMYTDIVCEKLYSFWHRIGDLIASFFPNLISKNRIYFTTAFDVIPKEYHDHESYIWLKYFRENEYKELNEKRREIVHYSSTNTQSLYSHLFDVGDKQEIEKWIQERGEITEFSKRHLYLSLDGVYHTLTLLEHIEKIIFNDIE